MESGLASGVDLKALLGAHCSAAGTFVRALQRVEELSAECVQIFTRAPGMWRCRAFSDEEAQLFRQRFAQSGLKHLLVHDIYLTNLAAINPDIRSRSIATLAEERERCARLGVTGLVVHMGAHLGQGIDDGLKRFAEGLGEVLARSSGASVPILLETSAGQGTCLGTRFDHIARVMACLNDTPDVAACADSCHMFAAGYDLATVDGYRDTWREFDDTVGLHRLRAFHINDSQRPLGSHVDRHEHVGKGHMGLSAFHRLVRDPRFAGIPMIIETPDHDRLGHEYDLQVLRKLRASTTLPIKPIRPRRLKKV